MSILTLLITITVRVKEDIYSISCEVRRAWEPKFHPADLASGGRLRRTVFSINHCLWDFMTIWETINLLNLSPGPQKSFRLEAKRIPARRRIATCVKSFSLISLAGRPKFNFSFSLSPFLSQCACFRKKTTKKQKQHRHCFGGDSPSSSSGSLASYLFCVVSSVRRRPTEVHVVAVVCLSKG